MIMKIEPQDGYDVISTLDVHIQDIAHHALLEQLEKYEASYGSVVLMETKTGQIKAISNLSKTSKGTYYESLNHAVGESHEPGSTFKLMTMMALLEDTAIDTSYVVDTQRGVARFYDRKVYDSKRGGYGKISLAEAFKYSSNTAFAKVLYKKYKNQPRRLLDRYFNIGLNKKLNVSIKGEGLPKFPYPGDRNWYGTTLPWMAFGYGVSMTPLQVLTFYNAIANDGEMVKPQFVKEVHNWGKVATTFKKEILNPAVCSRKNVVILQDLLKQVVTDGTARNLRNSSVKIAGKTGTCQKNYNKSSEKELSYISSFVGYFPADEPKYSCIVVIHEPNKEKGFYGNEVAAPVFDKIAQKIYTSTPIEQAISLSDSIKKPSFDKYTAYKLKYRTVMPNVIGMPLIDALPLLENMGLKVEVKGSGKVTKQSIKKGTKIKDIKKVTLQLS